MKKPHLADLVLVAMTVVGASSTITAKYLLTAMSPLTLICVRFCIAATLLYAIKRNVIHESLKQSLKAGIAIGVGFGVGCILLYRGMQEANPGHAAFLTNVEVAIIPVMTYLIFKKFPGRLEIAGIFFAIIGLTIFTQPMGDSYSPGDTFLLLSACGYAMYTISLSHFSSHGSMSARIFVSFVTVAVMGGIGAFITDSFSMQRLQPMHYALLTYIIVVATVGRILGQSWGQATTSPTRTALIFTLEPLFTLIISSYLFDENFHQHQYIGGTFILIASALAAIPHAKATEVVIP